MKYHGNSHLVVDDPWLALVKTSAYSPTSFKGAFHTMFFLYVLFLDSLSLLPITVSGVGVALQLVGCVTCVWTSFHGIYNHFS